jgi:hypothetical protein
MTKRILFGFLITGSLMANAVFIGMWMARAAPRHFIDRDQCRHGGYGHRQCAMQKALSMNDSQWALLRPAMDSFREKISVIHREIVKNRSELLDELEKTPADSAALLACQERILARQKNMQALIAGHILEETKTLTQDQKKRYFNALRKNMTCTTMPGMTEMMPCKTMK